MSKKPNRPSAKSNRKIPIALLVTVIGALLTATGLVVGNLILTILPIRATQSAEAKLTAYQLTNTPSVTAMGTTASPSSSPITTQTPFVVMTTGVPTAEISGGMAHVPEGYFLQGTTPEQLEQIAAKCTQISPGCTRDQLMDEIPQRKVWLDSFWMDIHEVTIGEFQQFAIDTNLETAAEKNPNYSCIVEGYDCVPSDADWQHPHGPTSSIIGKSDYPVSHITYAEALAYCQHYGKRLPTEAEWEKAARGPDGWIFPWGDQMDLDRFNHFKSGESALAPVGSYPSGASIYGIQDLMGGVIEWVADYYGQDYYNNAPAENPTGPASGAERVTRGGGFATKLGFFHAAWRTSKDPTFTSETLGFRCAASSP